MHRLKRLSHLLKHHTMPQMANYALNKIETRSMKPVLRSYPVWVDIVPTLACNIDCVFCIKYDVEGPKHLSLEVFKEILRKLKYRPMTINFCSGGEPFLNKNMVEFLALCNRHRMLATLATNGTLLTEDKAKAVIFGGGVEEFSFSVDGFRKETVEAIRVGVDFDKVLGNMRMIGDIKKRSGRRLPLLTVRSSMMRSNIEELPGIVRMAKDCSFDRVVVTNVVLTPRMDPREALFYHQDLEKKMHAEARAAAEAGGIELDLSLTATARNQKAARRHCDFPWRFTKIDPDGSVRFCYRAFDNPIGNILEVKDFSEIWNGPHYVKIRETVGTEKPFFKHCSICKEQTYGVENYFNALGEYQFEETPADAGSAQSEKPRA